MTGHGLYVLILDIRNFCLDDSFSRAKDVFCSLNQAHHNYGMLNSFISVLWQEMPPKITYKLISPYNEVL